MLVVCMGTITINASDKVENKFRATVKETIGSEKGSLGKAFDEAMLLWVKQKKKEKIRERALRRLQKGYSMGKLLYKNRSELYER